MGSEEANKGGFWLYQQSDFIRSRFFIAVFIYN
jgi:hypothetical protein